MKGLKRKRLAKVCEACRARKRRCDGTAPCSNCYYASIQCTYTDASGCSVHAPRSFKPKKRDSQPSSSSDSHPYSSSELNPVSDPLNLPNQSQIHIPFSWFSDVDHKHSRKRFRNEKGNPKPLGELIIEGPISGVSINRPTSVELDPSLTCELTNLFFTHCQPARAIIHKPTFSADLSHNRVPSHLLLAVCALAAPLSKQPRLRTTPTRFAGKLFAQEALSQMFDGAGRLVCEPDLAAAQALCILQMHDIIVKEKNMAWGSRYHDLALQIVEGLGVHSPEHPTLTPIPSREFVLVFLEREAARRIFWLIHLLDIIGSIYFKNPVTFTDSELRLRLPMDEASFEMGVHSTLPEYLYLPAARTRHASEFGHLIRIVSIYSKVEYVLDEMNVPEILGDPAATLMEAEQKMEEWVHTLPEHLRFSEQSLEVQQSIFETSYNTGAWSWCYMHVYHASCILALNSARQRAQQGPRSDTPQALEKLELILMMLGDRAKNSILMVAALWSLIKFCKRDDPQVRHRASVYEEAFGTKVFELVQGWRSQPSPQEQHQYPSHLLSQPQPMQQQQEQQLSNWRLSDVRNPDSHVSIGLDNANPNSRPLYEHGEPSYSSGSSNATSNKAANSLFPTLYSLGRPANFSDNSSNNSMTSNGFPDSSSTDNSNRDSRISLTASGFSVGGLMMGPGGNGNDCVNPSATLLGVGGGGAGDSGMQQNEFGGPKNVNAQRILALPADGAQFLPSLKDSGLLDSWASSRTIAPVDTQKQVFNRSSSNIRTTSSGLPDPSSTNNSNKDSRISLTASESSVGGPMMGRDGTGNDCANPSATLLEKRVDQSSGIIAAQVLLAAQGALRHVSDPGRQAKIKEAFLDLQIVESQYTVLAGFNEALIRSGFGYLEEIHMFCSVEVPDSLLLLITLGKVLSPYPGIIFTPSSGYKTPVFKDDGTIWDYDDLCLHRTETHSNIHIKEILHSSKLNTLNTTDSQPNIYVIASGCSEGGGNDNHGGAGEDKGDGHSDGNNPDHGNPGDDPDDPEDAGNGDSSTPGISFDVQAKLFEGTSNSSSSKPFQVLEINGTLVVQTIPGQLKPKRIQFKSHVEFIKLNFQSMRSASLAYEQVYVKVEVDTKDKNTKIDVLQPLKTPAFDQETKEIMTNKMTTGGTATGSIGLINPAPTVSFSGSRQKETSSCTEIKKYHSRITESYSDGAVSWGFSVDDVNERQTGIGFGRHRALPSVDFNFYGTEDIGPPPPPPKHFDVLVTSCWSLISGNEGYTTSGWFSLFKGLGPGTAASKATLYSNLCQVVILEVPCDLSRETFHKSVSEINQSSSKTVVMRAGLCKITPTVLFLGGPPIESGNSFGPISPSLRR